MALVPCKECRAEISSNATVCPQCGTHLIGSLIFYRPSKFMGSATTMLAYLDDQVVGKFRSGDKQSIEVPVGTHTITGQFGNLRAQTTLTVDGNKQYLIKFVLGFSGFKIEVE